MSEALHQSDILQAALDQARELVVRAMAILDAARAPADIAAHLNFAIHRKTR